MTPSGWGRPARSALLGVPDGFRCRVRRPSPQRLIGTAQTPDLPRGSRDLPSGSAPQGRWVPPPQRRCSPCCARSGDFLQQGGRHSIRIRSRVHHPKVDRCRRNRRREPTDGGRGPRHRPIHGVLLRRRRSPGADRPAAGAGPDALSGLRLRSPKRKRRTAMTIRSNIRRSLPPEDLVLHADRYNLVRWWPVREPNIGSRAGARTMRGRGARNFAFTKPARTSLVDRGCNRLAGIGMIPASLRRPPARHSGPKVFATLSVAPPLSFPSVAPRPRRDRSLPVVREDGATSAVQGPGSSSAWCH